MTGLTKRYGYGVTLGVDSSGIGTTFTVLANIVDALEGPDIKTDSIEFTLLADKIKAHMGGQIDPGTVTFTIAYDPADATSGQVLVALLGSSLVCTWEILYPVIGAETQQNNQFNAFVSGFKRGIKRNEMITADLTLTLAGGGTYSTGVLGV